MFTTPETNVFEFGFIPGNKVADFGCGTGHYSLLLSHLLGSEGKIFAIDLSEESLLKLKKEAFELGRHNLEIIRGNIEKRLGSKLKSASLDGVLLSNVLFQVEDRPMTLIEARRVLRSGGKLCILDWPEKLHKSGLRKVVQSAGFEFVKEFPANDHHYGMIFTKENL